MQLAATQAAGVAVAAPAVPPCAISLHQHHEVKDMVIPTKNQIAQRIAELQPLRNKMSASMVDYLYLHAQKIAEIDAVREANLNRRARGDGGRAAPVPDPLPPLGVAATVGLGKSHAVNDVAEAAHKAGLPVVILTPNHALAAEYAQRLAHLKTTVYQGRREPARDEPPNGPPVDAGPHACYRLVQVSKAGDQNQRPAQGLCSKCPNWFSAHLTSRDEIKRERAEQFFQKTGIDPTTVPPCRFLVDGLPKQLSSQILIAPVQAFSEAMGILKGRDERGNIVQQTQRLVIVDEHIPLAQEVEIGAGDITVWRNRLEGLEDQIKQRIAALEKRTSLSQSEANDLHQLRESLPLLPGIDDLLKTLASKIAGDIELDQADVARIINLQKQSAKVGLSLAGTAAWEKVSYMPDEDDFFIPLRALSTLARNLEAGSARQEKGVLNVYETSPVLEWARDKGSVMFLDATMSQTMRRFIEAQGGKVVEATAEQNMRVIRLTGNLYARGEVSKDDYPAKARGRMEDVRQIAAQMDKPAAIITHKAYLKYSQEACLADKAAEAAAQKFEEETGVPIGWFGKHDRGMNDWAGRHIALVGMPLLSKEAIAGAYACTRAAMLDCGLAAPVWDGVMDKEKADANGPPMPVMPQVRAWLIDEYAQSVAQAVGRNRAVNHPRECAPLQVEIWGGLQGKEMNAAMARYGVRVQEVQRNPMSVSGPKVDAGAVDAAIEMVLATGGSLSERSVRAALVGLRRSASTESIRARLRELRATGAIPAATHVRGEGAKSAEASEASPETVFAARAHIPLEAVPVKAEAVSVEPQPQTQKQGQEKNSGLPNITTAPNSYKDTNNGNSAQSRDEEKPQTQGAKETFLAPVVAPRASAGVVPADADEDTPGPIDGLTPREREMLDAMLAELDELIASGELDPDDDPDPPQGPRGTPRRDPAPPIGSHPTAAFLAPQHSPHTADGGWRSGMGEHSGEWESDPDPPPGPAFAACAHIKAEGSTGASSP